MSQPSRRSQSRRSSNTLPIRPLPAGAPKLFGNAALSSSTLSSTTKRSSSIPRPSLSSTIKPPYGQNQNQSLAYGTTPSKAGAGRYSTATPQTGSTTPQSRGNLVNMSTAAATGKAFQKETRNFNDKAFVLEMIKNVVGFLGDMGFNELVTVRDLQKIDKQNFVKYFNFIYQYLDPNYQLGARFNEDELIKTVKDFGYPGTLAKSALQSIGALHSTSQLAGLLSWLCDTARMFHSPPYEQEQTIEKVELQIMMDAYRSWCADDEPVDLTEQFRALYKEKHQLQDGRAEMIERQIHAIMEERASLEKKCSQTEELREEAKRWDEKLDEITTREAQLHQKVMELRAEERHLLQNIDEIKERTAAGQKEVAELMEAAKNSKMSAEEARRIKAEIAANQREYDAISEQRSQVAKLVEKRELQLANIITEDIKSDRELNVDLMDMGMTVGADADRKEALKNFLDTKTALLSDIERECIAMTEQKERILAEISQLKMELKHAEHMRNRLEENIQAAKTDRAELEKLYLSQLSEMNEKISAQTRSDPMQMRQQYDLEALQQKVAEAKLQMAKQEKELQTMAANNAQELKDIEANFADQRDKALDYYAIVADGFKKAMDMAKDEPLTDEMINALIPDTPFE